jgi:hypothetical protein
VAVVYVAHYTKLLTYPLLPLGYRGIAHWANQGPPTVKQAQRRSVSRAIMASRDESTTAAAQLPVGELISLNDASAPFLSISQRGFRTALQRGAERSSMSLPRRPNAWLATMFHLMRGRPRRPERRLRRGRRWQLPPAASRREPAAA